VSHLKGDGTAGPVGEPQGAGDLLAEHHCACHEIEIGIGAYEKKKKKKRRTTKF
jgi:hypothetical protein